MFPEVQHQWALDHGLFPKTWQYFKSQGGGHLRFVQKTLMFVEGWRGHGGVEGDQNTRNPLWNLLFCLLYKTKLSWKKSCEPNFQPSTCQPMLFYQKEHLRIVYNNTFLTPSLSNLFSTIFQHPYIQQHWKETKIHPPKRWLPINWVKIVQLWHWHGMHHLMLSVPIRSPWQNWTKNGWKWWKW